MTNLTQQQSLWHRFKHYLVYELLHANDSPHRLSLGVAVGMFIAFTPTIPFQMILTVLFCFILRANKAVGLPVVWLTNPATLIPIYVPQYMLGCKLLGVSPRDLNWSLLAQNHGGFWEYSAVAWNFMLQIFWPLWIGSLLVSTILGLLSYYGTRMAIIKYRIRRYGSIEVPVREA